MRAGGWVRCVGILTVGCAASELPSRTEIASQRGVVVARGPSVKAVTVGPATIHAFSADKGGGLYFVPFNTGTDADCATNVNDATAPSRAIIEADRRFVFSVTEGDLACVATEGRGRFELLWHTYAGPGMRAAAIAQTKR
jgi:hypothetical protein